MITGARCPRCGTALELPIIVRPRLIHEDDGGSYVTAITRAGKVDHTCPARPAPAWEVTDG